MPIIAKHLAENLTADQFYEQLDPARWTEHLCPELAEVLKLAMDVQPIGIESAGYDNIKAPELVVLLDTALADETIAVIHDACDHHPHLNVGFDGVCCPQHWSGFFWRQDGGH